MTEITLNGEVYVKKSKIEIDHEMAVSYFKNIEEYKFIQLVDEIVLDEILGVVGVLGKNIVFCNEII